MTLLETLFGPKPAPPPVDLTEMKWQREGKAVYTDLGFLPKGVVVWLLEREFFVLREYLGPRAGDSDSFELWGGHLKVQLRLAFHDSEIDACLAGVGK